jgi:DNA-binding transcriptional MerR regulator
MSALELPDKIYFKIGEVSELLDLQPHVLRYWENEFDILSPSKSKSGQRLYRRKDVEVLDLIKDLLHRQKFTIKGARQHIKTLGVGKALEEKEKRDESDQVMFLEDLGKRLARLRERADDVLEKLEDD